MNINSFYYLQDDEEFSRFNDDTIGVNDDPEYGEKPIGWIAMHQIASKFQIFGSQISPKQIIQGSLGNCYLLAALSSLANINDGKIIRSLFQTQEDNVEHVYVTKWILNGKTRFVAVDDWIPKDPDYKKQPAFAQVFRGNVFWGIILEKAWAKIHGSYMDTQEGSSISIYEALVQGNEIYFSTIQFTVQELYEKIKELLDNNFPVNMQSYTQKQQLKYKGENKEVKLLPGHSYAVLNAYEVRINQNYSQKLIQVFNPWNKEIWVDNPWGGNGNKWTFEMKKQYEVNPYDGAFHLTPDDFHDQFLAIQSMEIHEDYDVFWQDIPFRSNRKRYYIHFQLLNQNTKFIKVYLDQLLARFEFKKECQVPYEYHSTTMIIQSPNEGKRYQDNFDQKFVIIQDPQKGLYQIQIKMEQISQYVKYFTMSIYAPKNSIKFIERKEIMEKNEEVQCLNNCNGKGICNTFNGQCNCNYLYGDTDCSMNLENPCPEDCNRNGICKEGACKCFDGYYGLKCEPCKDKSKKCKQNMKNGDCLNSSKNIDFMKENCQQTCADAGYSNFQCYIEIY